MYRCILDAHIYSVRTVARQMAIDDLMWLLATWIQVEIAKLATAIYDVYFKLPYFNVECLANIAALSNVKVRC